METGQNLDGPQQIGSLSDLNDVYKRFSDYYILLAGIGLPEVSSTYERDAKVPAGGIAGGAVGGIISVIVVLGICVVCMRRKRQSQAFGGTPFMLQVEDVQPVPYDGTAPTHWHIKSRITERRNGNEADASAGGANATPSSGQPALTLTRQAEPARSEADVREREQHVDSGWRPDRRASSLPPTYMDATRSIRLSTG